MKINPDLIGVVVIAGLSVALVKSCSYASNLQSDNDVLRSDNSMLGQVIATQAFNFNRFNQVAEHANMKWFTEFGHLNRGDMLTSEQHRCHNEKKKFQRRV